MQDVNENMDELFRRAAENYPLDTSSKDWNKVQLALQNDQAVTPPVKKDNRGKLLWLLLLLPVGLICNRYILQGDSTKKISGSTEMERPGKNNSADKEENKNTVSIGNETLAAPIPSDINSAQSKTGTGETGTQKNSLGSGNSEEKNPELVARYNKTSKKNSAKTIFGKRQSNKQRQDNQFDEITAKNKIQGQLNSADNNSENDLVTKTIPLNDPYQLKIDPLQVFNKNIVTEEPKKKTENKKEKKFYVGLMGGADITTIKFQKIEDAGYSYGVLLGYDLSKKWSIETGVYQVKKFYYTDGEYFNTSKVWMPSNSKITEVSGNCKMIEIPLTVRYTISSSQKRSWFASAGTTSYLMQKEDYDYTYYYANSGNYATHNRKYDSDSKELFAAVHISGGYARKLNKTIDLRIEPYIKIPVAGMGIGELRFISTGIHLGLTKKLF